MPPNFSNSSETGECSRWNSSIPVYLAVQRILENAEQQLVEVFNARETALLDELSKSQKECTVLAVENKRMRELLEKSSPSCASSSSPAKSSLSSGLVQKSSPSPAKSSLSPEFVQNPTTNIPDKNHCVRELSPGLCFRKAFPQNQESAVEDPVIDTASVDSPSFPFTFKQDLFSFCSPIPSPRSDDEEKQNEEFVITSCTTTPSFAFSEYDIIHHEKGDETYKKNISSENVIISHEKGDATREKNNSSENDIISHEKGDETREKNNSTMLSWSQDQEHSFENDAEPLIGLKNAGRFAAT